MAPNLTAHESHRVRHRESQPEYLCVIPARGGSKSMPGKNLRPIAGKPLIAWSIEHALATPKLTRVIVSTDDESIARVARSCGAEVPFLRPAELATDDAPTEPTLIHAVRHLRTEDRFWPDAVVLLQPTSPLRAPGTLGRAIAQYESDGADCLFSACEIHPFLWRSAKVPMPMYDIHKRPRRQDIPDEDRIYEENGSIYITQTESLLKHESRLTHGRITMFLMDKQYSVDVDTTADFNQVEAYMTLAART